MSMFVVKRVFFIKSYRTCSLRWVRIIHYIFGSMGCYPLIVSRRNNKRGYFLFSYNARLQCKIRFIILMITWIKWGMCELCGDFGHSLAYMSSILAIIQLTIVPIRRIGYRLLLKVITMYIIHIKYNYISA